MHSRCNNAAKHSRDVMPVGHQLVSHGFLLFYKDNKMPKSDRATGFDEVDATLLEEGGKEVPSIAAGIAVGAIPKLDAQGNFIASGLAVDAGALKFNGTPVGIGAIPAKASAAEVTAGADDAKFVTAKDLKDAGIGASAFVGFSDSDAHEHPSLWLTVNHTYGFWFNFNTGKLYLSVNNNGGYNIELPGGDI